MKKIKKILLSIGISLLILLLCFTGYQKVRYNRSAMAGIAEMVVSSSAKDMTEEAETNRLKELYNLGKEYTVDVSSFKTKSELSSEKVNNRTVWHLNEDNHTNKTIIYIHGGGYVAEISSFQWEMIDKLAQKIDAEVIVPDYGLAPFYSYESAYALLTKVYMDEKKEAPDNSLYIVGDSAGGGLSLGLNQYFIKNNIQNPDGIILISPWVDVTLENPDIKDYLAVEPMLDVESLRADGKSWAKDTDTTNWMVSPIYGEMTGLPKVLLFTGTHEIFYPDIALLNKKLESAKIKTTFVIGKGLNHVYPAFPIPEANDAIDTMVDFILE